jgi:hypothetical protein
VCSRWRTAPGKAADVELIRLLFEAEGWSTSRYQACRAPGPKEIPRPSSEGRRAEPPEEFNQSPAESKFSGVSQRKSHETAAREARRGPVFRAVRGVGRSWLSVGMRLVIQSNRLSVVTYDEATRVNSERVLS